MKIIDPAGFHGIYRGKKVALFTLRNGNGLVVQITNFGAKIASIFVPDRHGNFKDVAQGYDSIEEWLQGFPYFGAICGRYANRIALGKFSIDGSAYQLPINNGPNSLHGGPDGFHDQVFDVDSSSKSALTMHYRSKNGEAGYPGNLDFRLTYSLTESNELVLDYHASTDKTTPINICSHSFFNLAGCEIESVEDHVLMINAQNYTPVNEVQIPTGKISTVAGTPMDFRKAHSIADHINDDMDQLKYGLGYDHNWVIDKPLGKLGLAASYSDPQSGRIMEVYTTQPGIHVYTANWHDGSIIGKNGVAYKKRSALCLEAQHFPDSPNQSNFPSTLIRPGEVYRNSCIYKFSTLS